MKQTNGLWRMLLFSLAMSALLVGGSCERRPESTKSDVPPTQNTPAPSPTQAEPALIEVDSFDVETPQPNSTYLASTDIAKFLVQRDVISALELQVANNLKATPPLGVVEIPLGSNRGPEVDAYLKFCKVAPPAWWCAAFVTYQIHEAAKTLSIKPRWPKFAMCVDIFNWGTKHGLVMDTPLVPSVMLIPGDPNKGERPYKHTGFVIAYDQQAGIITTVEGNSNNNGSSNGIGVFSLRRRLKPGMKFVKIV
jgi:hypothetical protein